MGAESALVVLATELWLLSTFVLQVLVQSAFVLIAFAASLAFKDLRLTTLVQ